MADNDGLRKKAEQDLRKMAEQWAARRKKAAERAKLNREKERLARINAKIQMLEQHVALARQPQRKLSCQQQALAGQPGSPPAEQRTLLHSPPHTPPRTHAAAPTLVCAVSRAAAPTAAGMCGCNANTDRR